MPDVVAPDLAVLFCGINPSLWSVAVGHHFAHPGNRFWKVLYEAGFTPRLLAPEEDHELAAFGLGVTNLVSRATAQAAELSAEELRRGGRRLEQKVRRLSPTVVAFVGVTAYRIALGRPRAAVGAQDEAFGGSASFVVPNPSGLQAHYQMPAMVSLYSELRRNLPG